MHVPANVKWNVIFISLNDSFVSSRAISLSDELIHDSNFADLQIDQFTGNATLGLLFSYKLTNFVKILSYGGNKSNIEFFI